jgi:cytochrome c oxidase assembly protein subunit 15
MRNLTKFLAHATTVGMLLVLLMGALVTKTDSGRGCGDDWPLCNGKFVPAYTISSIIEYSHRFVTGIVGMLMLGATIAVLLFVRRRAARVYVLSALFFTLLQAALGAFAVLWPQSSSVLALHFGFSLLAFACTLLLSMTLWKWDGSRQDEAGANQVSFSGFGAKVWVVTIYCYAVVYIGAFVRHTESYAGCSGWPLCNGQVIPTLSGATGIMFGHRVAALLLLIAIILLYRSAASRYAAASPMRRAGRWALILVTLQIFSGAFVTFSLGTDWYLLASLTHTVLIASLFGVLCYLCSLTVTMRRKPAAGRG